MIKADLKAKWGKYCNTDKLVDDVMQLLSKYSHANTEHGVCKMLDTYFTNKQNLIEMFKTSSNYIGDMRIVVDVELERENNAYYVRNFCDSFVENVGAANAILKKNDENGKTLDDYMSTGVPSFTATDLMSEDLRRRLSQNRENRNKFTSNGNTVVSMHTLNTFRSLIDKFRINPTPTLGPVVATYLREHETSNRYTEGMKTSRAFNRVCTVYKVNELPEYNKLFAKYSDMVSGLKRKMKFFISLNPLDYLTMSFGNSWASCHTIDRSNRRGMPNDYHGAFCGGTVSYMLDSTSIITYTHDGMPESYEDGKVYRNMFHYENGTLIQGRIYPQGMDGSTDLYKTFRGVVQNVLSEVIGLTNKTWVKRNARCEENTSSVGVHYYDYIKFGDCNVSYPSEKPDAKNGIVHIGHARICPKCGNEFSDREDSGRLVCRNCR